MASKGQVIIGLFQDQENLVCFKRGVSKIRVRISIRPTEIGKSQDNLCIEALLSVLNVILFCQLK